MGNLPVLPKPGTAISAMQALEIERGVIQVLTSVDDIDEAEEWRCKAKGIEAYLRSPELQRPILGAQRRIEGRIGQLLGPAENHGPVTPNRDLRLIIPFDKTRADYRWIAKALTGECLLKDDEWRKSRRAIVSLIRYYLGAQPETPDLPDGVFSCIVADPPWQVTTGPQVFDGTGEHGNEALPYETLSVDEIAYLKDTTGKPFTECVADDAHLYLWTINKYIESSYHIARAWGFKPSTLLTWCKPVRGVGLGGPFRFTTEFILFATRGALPTMIITPTTWFTWPRGKHSQKPDEFYQLVEQVSPSNLDGRLDLFARVKRDGWIAWGDEA